MKHHWHYPDNGLGPHLLMEGDDGQWFRAHWKPCQPPEIDSTVPVFLPTAATMAEDLATAVETLLGICERVQRAQQ